MDDQAQGLRDIMGPRVGKTAARILAAEFTAEKGRPVDVFFNKANYLEYIEVSYVEWLEGKLMDARGKAD